MKIYINLFSTIYLSFICLGCSESFLDKEAYQTITESLIWEDKSLIDSYLANIYFETDFSTRSGETDIHNQNSAQSVNAILIASMSGFGRSYGAHHHAYGASTTPIDANGVNSSLDYWKYDNIRNCNELIERLNSNTALEEEYRLQRISEARFLRSYMYFQMVIRFGGIPLVTKVSSTDVDIEDLFVPRNSEKEIYDFIISEMNDIEDILPPTYGVQDRGRPTSWAAVAFKSRVAIYAASIAKNADVQLDGLLGFPKSDVENYASIAYEASKSILDNGIHSLYKKFEDPEENFQNIFIDESDDNREVIMWEVYDYSKNRGHAYSSRATPHEFNGSWGSMYLTYDLVERFEFMDGQPGNSISREELESQEWTMESLFGERDPRFNASVFYPETPWKTGKAYFHSGTMRNGEILNSGVSEDGWQYKAIERNTTKTGFMIKKRLSPEIQPMGFNLQNDDTDFIIFRLGEIYLNFAEAAFYLNRNDEALSAVNLLRDRVGMPPKVEISMDVISNERFVELAMENHSFWDMRRWRIAEELLDGTRLQGIEWIFNYDTKKYKANLINAESVARIFKSHYYYMPLSIARVSENPNIIENPGY